ncbi:hypothetical protein [Sphingomonas sp.]|jgi:hypothetical protein|uniref:hypothetical protein n=1 Tax=Sphingomonas sp. TaxID=28214 RepID=UPI002EDAF619
MQTNDAATAPPPPPPASTPIIFEAIVKQHCVAATYNRGEVILAPHVIYTRHGELHIDAVTIERDGKPPKEVKLGTFKLVGLGAVRLTPRRFERNPLFASKDEKYQDGLLMAVEG